MAKNEIVIKFLGDDSRFNKVIKDVENQTGTFSTKVSNNFSAMKVAAGAAFAGAGAAAIAFGKSAIGAASDLAENQSKVNTVFGDMADAVSQYAKAADAIGLSDNAALTALGTFGNLFDQLGIGSKQSADMSKSLVSLAADLGSFHNADITEVIEAQTAAFRGEYDSLQRFIPTINAAAVEQKALAMTGKATTKELTAQEKALAVQKLMLEGAGKALGDYERTSDSLANRQRTFKARMDDVTAAIGKGLIPIALGAFDAFESLGKALTPVIDGARMFFNAFKTGFTEDEGTPIERVALILREHLIPALQAARDFVGQVVAFIGEKFREFQVFAQEVFPQVQEAIGHFVSVVQTAWRVFGDDILRVAQEVWSQIQVVVETVIGTVQGIIQFWLAIINGDWGRAWDALRGIVSTVFEGIKATIGNAIGAILGVLGGVADAVRRVGRNMWDGILDGFKSVINRVIALWNRFTSKLKIPSVGVGPFKTPGVDLGSKLHITPLASGGIVKATPGGSLILAGEGGRDEAVVPLPRGGGLMGGVTNIIHLSFNGVTTREAADQVVKLVEDHLARGGSIGDGRGHYLRPA